MVNNKYLDVKGEQTVDYFKFYCAKCGSNLKTEFLGYDPSVALLKFTCQKCGTSTKLKVHDFWETNK